MANAFRSGEGTKGLVSSHNVARVSLALQGRSSGQARLATRLTSGSSAYQPPGVQSIIMTTHRYEDDEVHVSFNLATKGDMRDQKLPAESDRRSR